MTSASNEADTEASAEVEGDAPVEETNLDGANPDAEDTAVDADAEAAEAGSGSIEEQLDEAVAVLVSLRAERDDYLDMAQRERAQAIEAKRRWERERTDIVNRAEEKLVRSLLPVLDTCDAAAAHGSAELDAVAAQLTGALTSAGLERIDEADVPFDPQVHEAVQSEEGDDDVHMVTAVLRTGYRWRGNLLRPAMVAVRG